MQDLTQPKAGGKRERAGQPGADIEAQRVAFADVVRTLAYRTRYRDAEAVQGPPVDVGRPPGLPRSDRQADQDEQGRRDDRHDLARAAARTVRRHRCGRIFHVGEYRLLRQAEAIRPLGRGSV